MIELQVLGGCRANGPCQQGSLHGEGMRVVTGVNVTDKSKYDGTAVSPELIDEKTGLPFMESIVTRFPTMDFKCPFCEAPTKVNGVTNMQGIAVDTESPAVEERAEKSKKAMKEEAPWDQESPPGTEDPWEEAGMGASPSLGEKLVNESSGMGGDAYAGEDVPVGDDIPEENVPEEDISEEEIPEVPVDPPDSESDAVLSEEDTLFDDPII